MRDASPALEALLESRQFFIADLYTITLLDGTVLRYTSYDQALVSGAHTFQIGPKVEKSATHLKIGYETDEETVTFYPKLTDRIGGIPFSKHVLAGGFEGARMTRERAFMPTATDTSAGTLVMFKGRISSTVASATKVICTLRSDLYLLDQDMPRNLFGGGCRHTLFDSGCTLVKADFAVDCVVEDAPHSDQVIPVSFSPGSLVYDQGTLIFTSGVNEGVMATIRAYGFGTFVLVFPLEVVPAAGDTFTVYPGCAKTLEACTLFSNTINRRSFEFIPAATTAV